MKESLEFLTATETSAHSTETQSPETESFMVEDSRSTELFLSETPVVPSSSGSARNTKRQNQNQVIEELRSSNSQLELQIEEHRVNMRKLIYETIYWRNLLATVVIFKIAVRNFEKNKAIHKHVYINIY